MLKEGKRDYEFQSRNFKNAGIFITSPKEAAARTIGPVPVARFTCERGEPYFKSYGTCGIFRYIRSRNSRKKKTLKKEVLKLAGKEKQEELV